MPQRRTKTDAEALHIELRQQASAVELYQPIFEVLYRRYSVTAAARRQKFTFTHKLLSIDSTGLPYAHLKKGIWFVSHLRDNPSMRWSSPR